MGAWLVGVTLGVVRFIQKSISNKFLIDFTLFTFLFRSLFIVKSFQNVIQYINEVF